MPCLAAINKEFNVPPKEAHDGRGSKGGGAERGRGRILRKLREGAGPDPDGTRFSPALVAFENLNTAFFVAGSR